MSLEDEVNDRVSALAAERAAAAALAADSSAKEEQAANSLSNAVSRFSLEVAEAEQILRRRKHQPLPVFDDARTGVRASYRFANRYGFKLGTLRNTGWTLDTLVVVEGSAYLASVLQHRGRERLPYGTMHSAVGWMDASRSGLKVGDEFIVIRGRLDAPERGRLLRLDNVGALVFQVVHYENSRRVESTDLHKHLVDAIAKYG